MKKLTLYLIIIAIGMILTGIIMQYVESKCDRVDKNTSFWVRNCDYK